MFEDSTFETMGRTRYLQPGMDDGLTFAFNSSILLALVIIPIMHPEMLPQITNAIRMDAPTPVEEQRPAVRPEQSADRAFGSAGRWDTGAAADSEGSVGFQYA